MEFIKNAWYIAMWAENLKAGEPQERVITGEPIVIFKDGGGRLVALHNRCPHRFAPLHMGRVCSNGNLECGYHGLQFDAAGQCVVNPHGRGAIPPAARVRAFPVVERHSLIWVWLGDGPGDPADIPDLSMLDTAAPEHVTYRDCLEMEANYELVIDNLLDLSHTVFLHRGVLGNADTAAADIRVTQRGDAITVARWMPGVTPPGLFDMLYRRDGAPVDHWTDITWLAPSCLINDAGVVAPGVPRAEGTGIYGLHLITPVDARRTRYHFAAVRQNPLPFAPDVQREIMSRLTELRRHAFVTQDQPMIEAQQRMIDMDPAAAMPVLLEVDAGSVRYQRVLRSMLATH